MLKSVVPAISMIRLAVASSISSKVSEVISTYTYKQGLASDTPQYSYGAAIGLFISLINVTMLLIVNKITGKMSGSSLF